MDQDNSGTKEKENGKTQQVTNPQQGGIEAGQQVLEAPQKEGPGPEQTPKRERKRSASLQKLGAIVAIVVGVVTITGLTLEKVVKWIVDSQHCEEQKQRAKKPCSPGQF